MYEICIYIDSASCTVRQSNISILMAGNAMELKEMIGGAYHFVAATERKRITQTDMAQRIEIGYRTYLECRWGANAPSTMKALLHLLYDTEMFARGKNRKGKA